MNIRKFLLVFFGASVMGYAQQNKVGINTERPTEVLDVSGTLRVRELPVNGSNNAIYNGSDTKSTVFNAIKQVVSDNNGVLGTKEFEQEWFYMPSIVLPLTNTDLTAHPYTANITNAGAMYTIDIYEIYKKQFVDNIKSVGASALKVHAKDALDFFVTYYDSTVFENVSFNTDKKLVYTVKENRIVSEHTYMNIVFKVK